LPRHAIRLRSPFQGPNRPLTEVHPIPRRILVTGAAGKLGTFLRRELGNTYQLRLTDRLPVENLAGHEEFVGGDLRSMDDTMAMVDGVEGVVHLGGIPGEDDWPSILQANIEGTYHVFEAARLADVERIVFASSNHTVGFSPTTSTIGTDALVRPDSRYGVSKVFGEALGSLYADKYGRKVTCLRIGHATERPATTARSGRWLSPRDLAQLVRIGLDHPEIHYEVLFAISDNDRAIWDIERARELGYRPQDRAEDHTDPADSSAPGPNDQYSGGDYVVSEGGGHPPQGPRPRSRKSRRRLWRPR